MLLSLPKDVTVSSERCYCLFRKMLLSLPKDVTVSSERCYCLFRKMLLSLPKDVTVSSERCYCLFRKTRASRWFLTLVPSKARRSTTRPPRPTTRRTVSSERHGQSGANEIAQVSKRQPVVSNPGPLESPTLYHTTTAPHDEANCWLILPHDHRATRRGELLVDLTTRPPRPTTRRTAG